MVGRPRDERVDQAILAATRKVLTEQGYSRLTVDAVATAAGVGKAAIYRRYSSKHELVFAAAIHDLDLAPPPDGGSLSADLAALVQDVLDSLSTPTARAAGPGLLSDFLGDPALADRFEETFLARERACVQAALDRAVARGELDAPPDTALTHSLIMGPAFVWLYVFRREETETFARDLTVRLEAALRHTPPRT
ncbi:TetR/AcrR family transcriptional regulator [Nocardiopsis sp. FIRDI 009]|uniref:TetR/AcrR family transcriptional regulator n=1 Tax=Nocardiopsis sp. FIRDI 009 TaxID=714197 RepID=UPI000E26C1D7|nr:TetR/AcrR family transcriptional regulator [Nocardiopsis sp. FIRDI 009]